VPTEIDCRDILSVPEFEERARLLMPPMAYEFVASGAADEHTLRWNREAFERIRLRPRVLRDVSALDTRVALLGRELAFPILLAPTAYQRVLHPEGELATARGAAEAGATWIVSMGTTTALADLARAATSPWWFQLYFQSDREFTRDVVQQAEAAGCEALCLTVDSPIIGARNRQARAGFRLPSGVTTPHLYDIGHRKQAIMDPRRVAATWKDVSWLRALTRLPIVLKGILDAEDAELGIQAGAAGIIVSNHGARNLDTTPATIDALPDVAERVDGRVPVLVDGGIRRGTDVLKAIALGARAVLIGRPYCYGLSVAGGEGVRRVVDILRAELEAAMMLSGVAAIGAIDGAVLWDRAPVTGRREGGIS
jgi:4-hydroxymandelate oxidase